MAGQPNTQRQFERRDRYLRTILLLAEQSGQEIVAGGAIAKSLAVNPATATAMIQALAEAQLVVHLPHKGVYLTDSGASIARAALRRQRLVESFLCKSLGIGWEEVESTAARIAEAFPDELVERINQYLDAPHFDPHGEIIYQPESALPVELSTLNQIPLNARLRICRIIDHNPNLLRHLSDLAITIGAVGQVVEHNIEGDLVVLEIVGHTAAALSRAVGSKILVCQHESPK